MEKQKDPEFSIKDIIKIPTYIYSNSEEFIKLIGNLALFNSKAPDKKGLFFIERSDNAVFQYNPVYCLGEKINKNGHYPPKIKELKKIPFGSFVIYDCEGDSGYIGKNLNLFFLALKDKHFILYDSGGSTEYKENGMYRRNIYKLHSLASFTVASNIDELYNVLVQYPDFLKNRDSRMDVGVSVRDERVKSVGAEFSVKDRRGVVLTGKIISLNENGFSAMLAPDYLTDIIIGSPYTLLFKDTETTKEFICKLVEPGGFSVFVTMDKV